MGTSFNVKIVASEVDQDSIKKEMQHLLDRIDGRMSTYKSDSELSLLNQNRSKDWVAVSRELSDLLALAEEVSKLSGGAYDITVGPLVNLWGFGPDPSKAVAPAQEQINKLKNATGYALLEIDLSQSRVKKEVPTLYLDLSSIAKGYAVDKIAEYLEENGFPDYMVEVGGEIRVKGKNLDNRLWRIAIEKPVSFSREVEDILELKDEAIATSGDYRNYFEVEGKRFSHTIDPRTGWSIDNRVASVSVISSHAAYSDAMATAMMVLGAEKGKRLADQLELKVLFLVKSATGFEAITSNAMSSIDK